MKCPTCGKTVTGYRAKERDSLCVDCLITAYAQLRAVADRLPRYADTGEPIMPGSVVWILVSGKPKKDIVRLVQIDSVGEWWRGDLGYCQATYSTAKAALAAEENPDG